MLMPVVGCTACWACDVRRRMYNGSYHGHHPSDTATVQEHSIWQERVRQAQGAKLNELLRLLGSTKFYQAVIFCNSRMFGPDVAEALNRCLGPFALGPTRRCHQWPHYRGS